jgi:hypothetical protein
MRKVLLIAPLTPTQMRLSIIKLLSTRLLRQQELLALNTVRRFPLLGEANSIAWEEAIRRAEAAQPKFDYRGIFLLRPEIPFSDEQVFEQGYRDVE